MIGRLEIAVHAVTDRIAETIGTKGQQQSVREPERIAPTAEANEVAGICRTGDSEGTTTGIVGAKSSIVILIGCRHLQNHIDGDAKLPVGGLVVIRVVGACVGDMKELVIPRNIERANTGNLRWRAE